MSRQPAIIFDRDGTLASVKYIAPTTRDDAAWAAFNTALPFDAPVPTIVGLCRSIRPGVARIMTSGRMAGDRPGDMHRWYAMRAWLRKHDIPIDFLYMRDGGDTRRDTVVKEEMYRRHIEPYYDVRYVVDDRPEVCDMWESLGLKVMRVVDPGIEPPIATLTCNGSGRPWMSGTGSPICPVCHRGPNALKAKRPVRRSGRLTGKVPSHPQRTA